MNVCINLLFSTSKIPYIYIILLYFKNIFKQFQGLYKIKSSLKKNRRSSVQNLKINIVLRKEMVFYFVDPIFSTFRIESKT